MRGRLAAAIAVWAALAAAGCAPAVAQSAGGAASAVRFHDEDAKARAVLAQRARMRLTWPEERQVFRDAAVHAWAFANRHYQPATGFIKPFANYSQTTIWDVGSMIAALYSGRGLGLLDDAEYARRVSTLLATLAQLPLYNERAFNKAYDTRTGAMVFHSDGARWRWAGWSTTDLGRLLIWLKILAVDPRFQQAAEAVVRRNELAALVRGGYLWGEDRDPDGRTREYREGAIGYEQYAARGFELWGFPAPRALNLMENALPIWILGEPLLADFRRYDRLTSEPFLLWGLELGWDPQAESIARSLLRAQEARFRKTGEITITGEDAIPQPPHFFYYYSVYADGKEFAIDTQDRGATVDGPRWLSAKSAFAFHALMPTPYTERAMAAAAGARAPAGWASGIYEGSGRSTGSVNINTAAVVLTAALYNLKGEPLLAQARRGWGE